MHWNFGISLVSQVQVSEVLADRIRDSLTLSAATLLILIPLSVGLGVFMAVRRGLWLDRVLSAGLVAFFATPGFVIGAILIAVLATWLQLLPPVSLVVAGQPVVTQLNLLILPILTLLASGLAQLARLVRATMLSVLEADYVQTAILTGVPSRRLYVRHALPNAIGPTLQLMALYVGWVVGGQVVVEALFQFPGLGSAFASAIEQHDLPVVEAIAMLLTTFYIVTNLLADLLAAFLNPRVRLSKT